jgi:hypothetical protein
MRTQRLPGFTAAATLAAPRGNYRSASAPGFREAFGQAILPQQFPPDVPPAPGGYCRPCNERMWGWKVCCTWDGRCEYRRCVGRLPGP